MDASYSLQSNALNIANTVQDVPVVLIGNRSHESLMIPITTPPTTPPNENQSFLNNNVQTMLPSHSLQPTRDYMTSHPYSLVTHPHETAVSNEYSFFYKPRNDFQMYHIVCKEIPLSFELVAQLINNPNPIHSKIYIFYHEQPEIKKIYQVECKMIPHEFIFHFLNKTIYNIQSTNIEYQQQEFSKVHQENLKFHLKRDLIHYLIPKNVYEDNFNLHKRLVRDYHDYESTFNNSQHFSTK
jgi:hypothetical protein